MTTAEFLSALAGVRDQFEWTLIEDTGHHAERRAKRRFHVRGASRDDVSITLEPLRALCYARTGTAFGPDDWAEVADALDMSDAAASQLLSAANDRTWTGTGDHRAPSDHLLSLRKQLLEVVGLQVRVED